MRGFYKSVSYGIKASQSVGLTKVGSVLEENISIKKTEERLSRQLGRRSLGSVVQDNILKEGSKVDWLLVVSYSWSRVTRGVGSAPLW